jgi:hypothetical protein
MNKKMQTAYFILSAATVFSSSLAMSQESLGACSSEKTRQMELMRSIKSAPAPRYDPYTRRTYSRFDPTQAQEDVNRIDEWLWKNCRNYSEEMRKIEQGYM